MSYKKYYIYKQQYSEDGGITWKDTDPLVTSPSGDPIGEYATLEECQRIIPPAPTGKKLVATYTGGTTNEVDCNSNSTLTSGETKPSGYVASAMTSAVIGDCVTSIGMDAFSECHSLTSVTIPNSATWIGGWAFCSCNSLKRVNSNTDGECNIPNSVTSIGDNTNQLSVFYECTGLTSVNIGNSVTMIGYQAFNGCSGLTSVTIGNSVKTIGDWAFSNCTSLPSINIPNSVTSISTGAFMYCSGLTSVTIPNSVTSIGQYAFNTCGLTSVVIPNSITSISHWAFSNCSGLTSVTIPNSVTSIGNYGIYYCNNLPSITIPDSVKTIGNWAFAHCRSLTSVVIPSGVTRIGDYGFYTCSGLTSITCLATTPPTLGGTYVFDNTNNCPIYVPASSVNAYKSATNWSEYASRIQAIP